MALKHFCKCFILHVTTVLLQGRPVPKSKLLRTDGAVLLTGWMPFLSLNRKCQALKGELNKNQSNLVIDGIAPNWGFQPPDLPSCGETEAPV